MFWCRPENRLILLNNKQPVHIAVIGVVPSNADVMPLFNFLHILRQRPISSDLRK